MNPAQSFLIALAQSFLYDIATGTVSGDEMRGRAGLLARELEPYRRPLDDDTDTTDAGDSHRTLLDALLEAAEHEATGRTIQAANARAAVENLRQVPPWGPPPELELWAWIGEHSGELGLKQALVPAGMIALVSTDRLKLSTADLRRQLQDLVNVDGNPVRLVRLVTTGEVSLRIERTTWKCPHCASPPSHNPTDVQFHFCGHCHHYCDEVLDE